MIPAFSETVAGFAVTVKAESLSVTVRVVVTLTNPVAAAVMVTVAVPSSTVLSIAAICVVTDVLPTGIVTVVGTVAFDVLEDVSVTI